MQNKKNVSIRALPELGGGGLPLPEFFCALFLLKEKVLSMVATAERVGKVARIGGWGGGLANSGNARIETFFFLFCTRPLTLATSSVISFADPNEILRIPLFNPPPRAQMGTHTFSGTF